MGKFQPFFYEGRRPESNDIGRPVSHFNQCTTHQSYMDEKTKKGALSPYAGQVGSWLKAEGPRVSILGEL